MAASHRYPRGILQRLTMLSLSGRMVCSDEIQAIATRRLECLDLSSTNVTDDMIGHVPAALCLHTLDLSNSFVADNVVKILTGLSLPALKLIDLTGSFVSAAGSKRLEKMLPCVKVEWRPSLHKIGLWCQDLAPYTDDNLTSRFAHPRSLVDPSWERDLRPDIVRYLQ